MKEKEQIEKEKSAATKDISQAGRGACLSTKHFKISKRKLNNECMYGIK